MKNQVVSGFKIVEKTFAKYLFFIIVDKRSLQALSCSCG